METNLAVTIEFNYEALKDEFDRKLTTQLRGHGTDNEYLETWVPDEDPVKSILNMAEAALSSGLTEMRISFRAGTIDHMQGGVLVAEVGKIAAARLEVVGDRGTLIVGPPRD